MVGGRSFAMMAGVGMFAAVVATRSHAADEPSCELHGGPTRSVVRVIDSETVLLDDHSEVRLIGALSPRSPDLTPQAQAWPVEDEAIAALKFLVLGHSVSLATGGRAEDRYGRKLAHLFVEKDGESVWVQGAMLLAGHARAYGLPGSYACMRELVAHERAARDDRRGLWSNAAYRVRAARATRDLLRRRNSYEIVAGSVAKVATTKSRTYINFGTDWKSDFTAGIEAKVLKANPDWAAALAGLEGKRVEVRGWIQYRNGPYIDIEDPSQIVPVEDVLPGRSQPPSEAMTSSGRTKGETPEKEERPEPGAPSALDL